MHIFVFSLYRWLRYLYHGYYTSYRLLYYCRRWWHVKLFFFGFVKLFLASLSLIGFATVSVHAIFRKSSSPFSHLALLHLCIEKQGFDWGWVVSMEQPHTLSILECWKHLWVLCFEQVRPELLPAGFTLWSVANLSNFLSVEVSQCLQCTRKAIGQKSVMVSAVGHNAAILILSIPASGSNLIRVRGFNLMSLQPHPTFSDAEASYIFSMHSCSQKGPRTVLFICILIWL